MANAPTAAASPFADISVQLMSYTTAWPLTSHYVAAELTPARRTVRENYANSDETARQRCTGSRLSCAMSDVTTHRAPAGISRNSSA